jgi:hypothetical protein
MRTRLWRAEQAARGVLQRRDCMTWGMWQIHWAKLDFLNATHAMRYRSPKVLKRGLFDFR